MKTATALQTLSVLALLTSCNDSEPVDLGTLETEARSLTQSFVGTLLPTLQGALAAGGPTAAINVCSERAPEIAAQLSASSGWSVRRVSLKPRNADLAVPDAWERATLAEFDRRQQSGEAGGAINASAVVDGEYRYMQAQPTMPLCLTCHGEDLDPAVRSALAEHYPDDLATGYSAGQIRGAISLRSNLP
ncbi:MAG: DUF3365 domain-containing protein [Pseudohongiellaceae bacterium]|jgi:hypothetical protein